MSTSAVVPDQDVKPTSVTYGAFTIDEQVTDKKTNETSTRTILKATMQEKALAKAKADNTLVMEQSFSYTLPGTVAGFTKLGIPDEELINLLRQAITAKAGRIIVSLMEELDKDGNAVFQPAEGFLNIDSDIAEVGGRRGLTTEEKAVKFLGGLGLPADVMAAITAQINAAKSAMASAATS